jgi:peptidoglycan-associated lipoprotein
MSRFHSTASRSALASAALVSLALLAGCQSDSSGEPDSTSQQSTVPAVPAAGPDSTIPGDPVQRFSSELTQVGDRVHFALDRYDLSPEAEAILQRQAAMLETYQPVSITIEGHADERGTREYNLALGERRADTVRNYLVALGVQSDRIAVTSYGKERPDCAEAAEGCWSQNRRGVTVVNQ